MVGAFRTLVARTIELRLALPIVWVRPAGESLQKEAHHPCRFGGFPHRRPRSL